MANERREIRDAELMQRCTIIIVLIKCLSSLSLTVFPDLFVVDVNSDPLAQHQLHRRRVTELNRGFHDQVDPLAGRRDPVQMDGVVDGGIPGTHSRHLRARQIKTCERYVSHIAHCLHTAYTHFQNFAHKSKNCTQSADSLTSLAK